MKVQDLGVDALPEIVSGAGSVVVASDGRELIDLLSGFGSVFLGHGRAEVVGALQHQAEKLWHCGRLAAPIQHQAITAIAALLPAGLRFAGAASTGMEIVEFALRLAANHTQRREFIGFGRSMHGKSSMTAALCWGNALVGTERARVLPFVDTAPEAEILAQLARHLADRTVAAVLVEPIQGSNGCQEASPEFYAQLVALCHAHGTLCIVDEVLTGLYRTGTRFYCERFAHTPDILVFAKSIANGFPCAVAAATEAIAVAPRTLPGSTFAGNPLAAAAVSASLAVMQNLPMTQLIADIEGIVRERLAPCLGLGMRLRGRGALWALELAPGMMRDTLQAGILANGVIVSAYDRYIRLLPAATIPHACLVDACDRIVKACINTPRTELTP